MKTAELLIRKGVVKKQLQELEATLAENIRLPEADAAAGEEIEPLLEAIDAKYQELLNIGIAIGERNHTCTISPDGPTIDAALVQRDILIKRLTKLRETYKYSKHERCGYRDDTKYVVRLPPQRIRAMIDRYQTQLHELETAIQIANWTASKEPQKSSQP